MKIVLLGKQASVTHWLEDAAAAFRAEDHQVLVGFTRHSWLDASLENALAGPIATSIVRRIRQIDPDLILAIGAYHAPTAILAQIAALPSRAPFLGWVGDVFTEAARGVADLFDAVGYTDSGLLGRHQDLGFSARALYLPHAVDPHGVAPSLPPGERLARLVFIGNPTGYRKAVIGALDSPITLYGPAWTRVAGVDHDVRARRTAPGAPRGIYAAHFAALNIRNEHNVLVGLNQRNFDPCLAGAALLTDDQPDLERCFEPGREVLVWRDLGELNALYARLRREPAMAGAVGERGRRRVLAEHTYGARLAAFAAVL